VIITSKTAPRWLLVLLVFAGHFACQAATRVTCAAPANPGPEPTEYFVSLADGADQVAHVSIRLPSFSSTAILNMPVWNALYQVRNFAVHVQDLQGEDSSGAPVAIRQTGTSTWDIAGPAGCLVAHYDIYLDNPGPFGSKLNSEYGFFNWAMVLMYVPELKSKPASIRLLDVPAHWALRGTNILSEAVPGKVSDTVGIAKNYDDLVDSPAELGVLQQYSFQQDGATYHVVVHGDPADYDSAALQNMLKRATHATVDWMRDVPFQEYTFLYDFPRGPGSGGMEHAFGTAISASAASGPVDVSRLSSISTHEFFHAWNVKRIRPQSLEPVDYQHEQDTRALWFSEGLTNTVSELMRVRAGLIDEAQYLKSLAGAIAELDSRPAHLWQSAEDSSLEAWFEGDAFYRTPQRSISYYNKGELLGVLLDLRIRELTGGRKSLRDLFQWMNEHYAKQHRYFDDSAGVQQAAEAVTGQSFAEFFRDYVAGVKPLPYDESFRFVGLQRATETVTVADFGFSSTANLDGRSEVTAVTPGSDAERAGLKPGDRILEVNGTPAAFRLDRELAHQLPNQKIKLRIARGEKQHTLKIKASARPEQQSVLTEVAGVTPEQRAHRTAWIHGDDESGVAP